MNQIVKGPWIVKATIRNCPRCFFGKALTCHYHGRPNQLEIVVGILVGRLRQRLAFGVMLCDGSDDWYAIFGGGTKRRGFSRVIFQGN